MAPKQTKKIGTRTAKRVKRVSPRNLQCKADGTRWVNVRERTKHSTAHANSQVPQKPTAAGSGKLKNTIASTMPTRTSPRKRSCVRLFGPTHVADDGTSNAEIPAVQTPQEPATTIQTKDNREATNIHEKQIRIRGSPLPTRTSPRLRASGRGNGPTKAAEDGESIARVTYVGSQDIIDSGIAPDQAEIQIRQDGAHVEELGNELGSPQMEVTEEPSTGGSKTRGRKRGITFAKNKLAKKKMPVTAPPHLMRFVGTYAKQFVTEIGVVVRCHAPVHLNNWTDIKDDVKQKMIECLKESFEFPEDDVTMSALDAQMRRSFRSWRYRLYEKVKRCDDDDERAAMKPKFLTEEEWMIFVSRVGSDEFKKRSNTNKSNRSASRINHTVGTKSVARLIYENRSEEVADNEIAIDKIALFYDTHFSRKRNQWVDEGSKQIYERLVELRESTSRSVDEIFAEVLPSKFAAFRSIGMLPKCSTSRAAAQIAALTKTVEEQKAREEEHKIWEELVMKKNLELEERLADMERKVKILLDIHDSQTPLDSFDDTLSGL